MREVSRIILRKLWGDGRPRGQEESCQRDVEIAKPQDVGEGHQGDGPRGSCRTAENGVIQ